MKILAICSSLDLRLPYSCTPAWWQLLKALAESGVEVVATPYAGDAVETPWWRAYENPCRREGDWFATLKKVMAKTGVQRTATTASAGESHVDKLTRQVAQTWVKPRWERHIARILEREPDISAVLVLTVPLNQIVGVPRAIEQRFGVPFYYYDGDVPASLPGFAGFLSGFRIYQGADPSEYEAFFSNSKGGAEELKELGARRVHTLYYAADPTIFAPVRVEQDIDVFFYGHGGEYRQQWISAMLSEPSTQLKAKFAVRGGNYGVDLGRTESLPYLSFAKLSEYCCRSKINLLITRQAHASVHASSTARPFELASLGACMVSNPYLGIEEWFEPGKEVIVVGSTEEAVERYRWLLTHDAEREGIRTAARSRLLKEHTFAHRATQLLASICS